MLPDYTCILEETENVTAGQEENTRNTVQYG